MIDEIQRRELFRNFVFADFFSADILPEGVNKGVSLRSLAAIQGIPLDRVAVIGDWLNDLDMFKVGGFKIAMGNAPDELKAQADLIAPTNDERRPGLGFYRRSSSNKAVGEITMD